MCVHVLMQSRCSVRVKDRVYCVRGQCEMLCSHPPPHSSLTHAHSSSGGQVPSLPQPKPVPTEGGEGEGEEPLLNKMANQWMSTRDLMKVCACACVCVCVYVQCPIRLTLCPLTPHPWGVSVR